MKSLLDKSFAYTNAANTDIRKTFKRIEREQKDAERRAAEDRLRNVVSDIKNRKHG